MVLWVIGGVILIFGFVVFRGAPYVPSQRRYVEQAFTELYPLGPKDVLVDVGSGDGIVLRLAAKTGAKAIGYELNPVLVLIATLLSRRYSSVSVHLADFWLTSLPADTTVVYAFMVTRDMAKFTTKMQNEAGRLAKPINVILYGNHIPGYNPIKGVAAYKLYRFTPNAT